MSETPSPQKRITNSVDDEVNLRRERGRRAQATFRQRKAQETHRLVNQNRQLIRAVERVVEVTSGEERPELLNAVTNLSEIAGVSFTPNSRHIDPFRSTNFVIEETSIGTLDAEFGMSCITPSSHLSALPEATLKNLWMNPLNCIRISIPPNDITAYIGSGQKTLAGCLFWSVLEHARGHCKRNHLDPVVLVQRALSHSTVSREIKASFILTMIDARLEYKNTGSISPCYAAAAEADLSVVVHERVLLDYRASGKDFSAWFSCQAMEEHLRRVSGSFTVELLTSAARGQGRSDLIHLMNDIKCVLYETSICFGDGPRWHVSDINGLFREIVGQALRYISR